MGNKKNNKKGIQQDLIEWRRMEVARLLSRGKSINDIAIIMKVDPRTIYSDQKYIRDNASGVMQKYIVETLPNELSKCLLRLNHVSNEAWAMIDNQKLESRDKIAALGRAESAATNIIEILTNNKQLVYAALKEQEAEPKGDTEPKGEEEPAGEEELVDEQDEAEVEEDEEPVGEEDDEFPSEDTTKTTTTSERDNSERVF